MLAKKNFKKSLKTWFSSFNDLYEAGLKNDKFTLLFKMNERAQVAVKTAHRMTE